MKEGLHLQIFHYSTHIGACHVPEGCHEATCGGAPVRPQDRECIGFMPNTVLRVAIFAYYFWDAGI